ncbi:Transthyretin-like family protein [Ostertagia ostertagi]
MLAIQLYEQIDSAKHREVPDPDVLLDQDVTNDTDEIRNIDCSIWLLPSLAPTIEPILKRCCAEEAGIRCQGSYPDDLLDEDKTAADGTFTLKGSESELTTISPVFKIYHDSRQSARLSSHIPSSYISTGPVAKRMFDIGVLNLETIFPGEERDLI